MNVNIPPRTPATEVEVHARAKYPCLLIETPEEGRVVQVLARVASGDLDRHLLYWSVTKGLLDLTENIPEILAGTLKTVDGTPITVQPDQDGLYEVQALPPDAIGTADPLAVLDQIRQYPKAAVILLADYHPYLREDPVVIRKVRDLFMDLKATKKTVVLVSPKMEIPKDLEKVITVLDLPLPNRQELGEMLDQAIADLREVAGEGDARAAALLEELGSQIQNNEKLADAAVGLTRTEWENVIAKCLIRREISVAAVNEEKRQIIRKGGLLEYIATADGMDAVGGLENLKAWIRRAGKRFTPAAEAYGLQKPRGILLVGPPGTGKSLCAKVAAHELQLPALRMDMSALASKYYGETSNNIKKALDMADAIAPVELWLDEVEKMFGTGQGGHEETMRSLGALLTHFEESTQPVFRVATCNNIANLPPEFMARFEKVFFVDLPTLTERKAIFAIHLRAVGRDPAAFDLDGLAEVSPGFVGREIRNLVQEALQSAFYAGEEIATAHLLAEIGKVVPLAKQKESELRALRDWALMNAVPASLPDPPAPAKAANRTRRLEI